MRADHHLFGRGHTLSRRFSGLPLWVDRGRRGG